MNSDTNDLYDLQKTLMLEPPKKLDLLAKLQALVGNQPIIIITDEGPVEKAIMEVTSADIKNNANFQEVVIKAKDAEMIVEIPDHLDKAAQLKLSGKPHAIVSKVSGGKLSKFASNHRKQQRYRRR